jgi:hypothetical protein
MTTMTTDQNRVIHLDPDALVQLPPDVFLAGVRHDEIGGHNTIALVDLARHIIDMAEAREHLAAERDRLATVADHPAATYADSTTTPLPGKVERWTNPTTALLNRVIDWEHRRINALDGRASPYDTTAREAVHLLRDAVQVLRTEAVDTLRAAAEDVFDTAMPAYMARWLEARALVLERGQDVHDPDVFDAAIAEVTAAAAERAR